MTMKHRGCTAVQETESNHVHIYRGGCCVCHMAADERMNEEELREAVDCYLEISRLAERKVG